MAITAVIPWGPGHVAPCVLVGRLLSDPLVARVVVVADGHSGEVPGALNQSTGPTALGPAAARNRGAALAATPLVLFVDADVTLPEGWVAQAVALLEHHGDAMDNQSKGVAAVSPPPHPPKKVGSTEKICAVMGLYAPGAGQGRLGQYKNQWLRFSYARSPLTRGGLLSSALLIHKADFDAVGGFDETFTRPSVEDTDLGRRLLARGGVAAVLVSPGLGHDKSLSLSGMLRLTYQRAFALARLRGGRTQSSLPGFLYAVMFFALVFWPGVALGLRGFAPGWGLAAGCVLGLIWAAKDFFVSLSHDLGPAALVWAVPLMMLEMPVAFLGGVCGVMWPRRPARERGAPHA